MKAKILSNYNLDEDIFKMELYWEGEKPKPGQFIMIDCKGKTFLKRPISICDFEKDKLSIVYQVKGEGTKNLSLLKPMEEIEITGPHGNGYDLSLGIAKKVLIIGGGIGIPPLLYLSKNIRADNLYIALGYKTKVFLKDEFEKAGEVFISTEDGSYGEKGLVTNMLENIIDNVDIIYGCGPKAMLKELKNISLNKNILCQISMEERMACGVGACLGCAVKIRTNEGYEYKKVCKDGPVFFSKEVEL